MKKRIVSALLVFFLVLTLIPSTFAAETINNTDIIYFEDGSYLTFTIEEIATRASGTKSGTKICSYTDSNGMVNWEAVLTGTFTYTGTTAACTASSCSITIYDDAWYTVSKSATRSGNTANAAITMGRKVLGITVAKKDYQWSLSCDKNGNLS